VADATLRDVDDDREELERRDDGGLVVVVPSPRWPPDSSRTEDDATEATEEEDDAAEADVGNGGWTVMLKLSLCNGASWRHERSPCSWKVGEPAGTPAPCPGPASVNTNVALCAASTAPAKAQKHVAARSSESVRPMTERMRVMG
jgi:hypothetical protein